MDANELVLRRKHSRGGRIRRYWVSELINYELSFSLVWRPFTPYDQPLNPRATDFISVYLHLTSIIVLFVVICRWSPHEFDNVKMLDDHEYSINQSINQSINGLLSIAAWNAGLNITVKWYNIKRDYKKIKHIQNISRAYIEVLKMFSQ